MLERLTDIGHRVGCAFTAFCGATVLLGLVAATYEPRFGLAVVGGALALFYLLDLLLLTRR